MKGIPIGEAGRLRAAARRTAWISGALAVVVGVSALAVNVAARQSEPKRTSLLPEGASVVVALDLSLSIPEVAYTRMRNAMNELAASNARVGLVLHQLGDRLALQELGLRGQPHQHEPCFGRLQRLDPVEQHPPDARLQRLDPLAHRGRRHVQVAGGRLEGAETDGDRECAQRHRIQLSDVFHS